MTPIRTPSTLGTLARGFAVDDRGATAVEYGLLVACLALLILGSVAAVGTNIVGVLNKVSNALK